MNTPEAQRRTRNAHHARTTFFLPPHKLSSCKPANGAHGADERVVELQPRRTGRRTRQRPRRPRRARPGPHAPLQASHRPCFDNAATLCRRFVNAKCHWTSGKPKRDRESLHRQQGRRRAAAECAGRGAPARSHAPYAVTSVTNRPRGPPSRPLLGAPTGKNGTNGNERRRTETTGHVSASDCTSHPLRGGGTLLPHTGGGTNGHDTADARTAVGAWDRGDVPPPGGI